MSVREYKRWIEDSESRDASLPEFFGKGTKRTLNVLKGNARKESVLKREAFLSRHFAEYCRNPTFRRRVAIRNWGFALGKARNERS